MIINELKYPNNLSLEKGLCSVDSNINKKQNFIDSFLKNKGYKLIGKGYYSRVYNKSGMNSVLKIALKTDVSWLHYAELCTNYNNQHFLKVSRIIKYDLCGKEYFISYMEKLQPLKTNKDLEIQIASWMITNWTTKHGGGLCWRFILLDWRDKIKKNYNEREFNKIIKNKSLEFEQQYPDFKKALTIVEKNVGQFQFDLHEQNIMIRNDNVPVIIDPFG
jgi:hypothetical protein